jgi:hypothetical protein
LVDQANLKALVELPKSAGELHSPAFWKTLRTSSSPAPFRKLLAAVVTIGDKAEQAGLDVPAYHRVKEQLQAKVAQFEEEEKENKTQNKKQKTK